MAKGRVNTRNKYILVMALAVTVVMTTGFYKRTITLEYYSNIERYGSATYVQVDCNPNEPCIYPEVVDFRVIVITYNRPLSLGKLLKSLDTVELDGAKGRMEIWIDRSAEGEVNNKTLELAQSYKWKGGPTRVHIQKKHVGILGQWVDTWAPRDESSKEIAIIFEDDISVSPFIYRWLKAVHRHFQHRNDYMGAVLTSDEQNSHDGSGRHLTAPKNDTVFMYKSIGTWGLSPTARKWIQFQKWLHTVAQPDPTFHPYINGTTMTQWFKNYENIGNQYSMWSQWVTYFAYKEHMYTVYTNLPKYNGDLKSCLCINRREKGLHNFAKGREDYCELLTTWKDEYIVFPENISTLDWNGLPKVGY